MARVRLGLLGSVAAVVWCVVALACLRPALARAEQCRDDITASDGYAIRSMQAEGRWAPQLPLPAGDYSPAKVSEAIGRVRSALDAERNVDTEIEGVGAVSILHIDSCVKVVDEPTCRDATGNPKCVDVAIRPHSLRLFLLRVGSNLLPIPRANRPTFFDEVPAPLLALNPTFATAYDRKFGLSQGAAIATNLLDLPNIVKGEPVTPKETQLKLQAGGRLSFTEPYYNANADLVFSRQRPGRVVENLALSGHYAGNDEPLGDGRYVTYGFGAGTSIGLRPGIEPVKRLTLGANYRWARNKLFSGPTPEIDSENAGEGRLVADGYLAGGFARLGLWGDFAEPIGDLGSYQRFAGMVGYAREFPIVLNQTIGVEVVASGGHAWGNAPEYARFFGGNSAKSFLYDAVDSPTLTSVPRGPLIRSLGEGQGGVNAPGQGTLGGTSFWGVSLNVSVPIPPWSRPLIPNEVVESIEDADGKPQDVTLKEVLKKQVAQGQRLLRSSLVRQGMAPDDATAQARDTWKEIQPVADFIADQANLFAVKPLFMLDVAQISGAADGDSRVRVALGGGLQLTVVVARFEIGYLYAVQRAPGDDRGNLFVRLSFQNLF
jgi:hypothetical protein